MTNSKIGRHIINQFVLYALLLVLAVIMLFPLYYLVNLSLKTLTEFLQSPTGFVKNPTIENYKIVYEDLQVFKRIITTAILTGISCFFNITISILLAYPLARNFFKGSGKIFIFVLVTMFLPGSLIANIVILKDVFFIYGTPFALVAMWTIGGIQLNTLMLIGFIRSLARDFDEAAFIDGCGYYKFIFVMVFPLLIPIVATLIMLKAIACWNDFLGPFIYMTDPEYKTLSTGLYAYMSQFGGAWNKFTAAIFIVALPMVVLYIFCQRFIIDGIVAGSIKG